MPQPINIQPLSVLKSRFKEAVKDVYDVKEIIADPSARPGAKPQHIFDFEDGIRLIVSRDKFKEKEVLHFSASVFEGYNIELNISARLYLAKFLGECTQHIVELSGCRRNDVHLIEITPGKGVPHWIVPLANLN